LPQIWQYGPSCSHRRTLLEAFWRGVMVILLQWLVGACSGRRKVARRSILDFMAASDAVNAARGASRAAGNANPSAASAGGSCRPCGPRTAPPAGCPDIWTYARAPQRSSARGKGHECGAPSAALPGQLAAVSWTGLLRATAAPAGPLPSGRVKPSWTSCTGLDPNRPSLRVIFVKASDWFPSRPSKSDGGCRTSKNKKIFVAVNLLLTPVVGDCDGREVPVGTTLIWL
jgi:hypothetical protein